MSDYPTLWFLELAKDRRTDAQKRRDTVVRRIMVAAAIALSAVNFAVWAIGAYTLLFVWSAAK